MINPMPFYYVQEVYQENQLGTRLNKRHIIPAVNIIRGKPIVASVNRAGGSGECSEPLNRGFRRWSPLRKFCLDWLKIDLNVVKLLKTINIKI